MQFIRLMRPSHWTKNLFLFAPLLFGRKLVGPVDDVALAIMSALGGFLCFCLASSAMYIFNDIMDRKTDRLHPEKKFRPIASGQVGIGNALILMLLCAVVALTGGFLLAKTFGIVVLCYVFLMFLYSIRLKNAMILDVIIISTGFCLRAVGGAVVIGVEISPWLIICTFALCLFLGFGKRRSEIAQLGDNAELFRKTLAGYTPELLAHMLDVSSGLAVVCFLLYAVDERTLRLFGTNNLVYTTPFVLYCVFRFSALIQKGKFSGPVQIILRDVPFQLGLVLWVLSCAGIIYADKLWSILGNVWAY